MLNRTVKFNILLFSVGTFSKIYNPGFIGNFLHLSNKAIKKMFLLKLGSVFSTQNLLEKLNYLSNSGSRVMTKLIIYE